jgi:hypothetical protein
MSEEQNNSQNPYGEDWTPSPDDPNYEAYLTWKRNMEAAQGHAPENEAPAAAAPVAEPASQQAPGVPPTEPPSQNPEEGRRFKDGYQRPHQENPDAEASDFIFGPFAKPGHWSDKPNPDAPWWANPYTYVGPGEWRKPEWFDEDEMKSKIPGNGQQGAASQQTAAGTEGYIPTSTVGAWVYTGDVNNPWRWDNDVDANTMVDGKPVYAQPGAWVATGDYANPWRWDAQAIPNSIVEGKPVYNAQAGARAAASEQADGEQKTSKWQYGIGEPVYGSGEELPDIPMKTRVMWGLIGFICGFFGLLIAFFVTNRYPRKQRNQIVSACWFGFFAWCIMMFVLMGLNGAGFFGMGGETTSGGSQSAF